jgi:hypothetical protein
MKRVKESIVPICEIIILIICLAFPSIIDLDNWFQQYLSENYVTPENVIYYWALNNGNFITGILLFTLVYWWMRSNNKDLLFNRENVYHDYPYVWYFICAKALGIKKCNLVNVPIYMQFKLVVHRTFDEFPLDDLDYPEMENQKIVIEYYNKDKSKNCAEYNMLLEDTYPISTAQLPHEKQALFTIRISRNDGRTVCRHFSQQFINSVINETRGLPSGVTLNVYATTNPKNTLNIARRVFTMADRGNVSHVLVFQQRRDGERLFERNGKRLY